MDAKQPSNKIANIYTQRESFPRIQFLSLSLTRLGEKKSLNFIVSRFPYPNEECKGKLP